MCADPHERIRFEMGVFEKHTDEEPWQQIGRDYLMRRAKTRQMLKKGKDMIDRGRVEHLINYVQEMLNRLQNQGGKSFEELRRGFSGGGCVIIRTPNDVGSSKRHCDARCYRR